MDKSYSSNHRRPPLCTSIVLEILDHDHSPIAKHQQAIAILPRNLESIPPLKMCHLVDFFVILFDHSQN